MEFESNTDLDSESDTETSLILQQLKEFEQEHNHFGKYYPSNIKSIHIRFIYIQNNQIEKMTRDLIMLPHPNILKWNHLLKLVGNNNYCKYKLQSVAKYHFSDDSKQFTELQMSQDIVFQPAVQTYHDLNEIILLLKENKSYRQTRCKSNRISKSFTKKTI